MASDTSSPALPLPLHGFAVVSLAANVPGPVACARLRALGARVVKVEPPAGDPLEAYSASWYRALAAGQEVVRLDLKDPAGRGALDGLLAGADLLVTSSRLSALERLGLGREALRARHPRLCQVAIFGHPGAERDRAGHDLTYQAAQGLAASDGLPRTLLADLASAERAVGAALGLLLARLRQELGIAELTRGALEAALGARTAAEWEAWADERDLPLAALRQPGG